MLKVVQDAKASNENTASSSPLSSAFADEVDEHGRRLVVRNG